MKIGLKHQRQVVGLWLYNLNQNNLLQYPLKMNSKKLIQEWEVLLQKQVNLNLQQIKYMNNKCRN